MKQRLRQLGERWPWFGRALDVQTPVAATRGGIAVDTDDDPPAVPSPE